MNGRTDVHKLLRNKPFARQLLRVWLTVLLMGVIQACALAEPIPVRRAEGTVHGFLALRTKEGQLLAAGDLFQVVHGDRVTVRLVFRFKDGSLDDETTVYSQRKTFQLITDHHIQKGPFFPHPMDLSVDARSGQVTVRSTGKDGKQEVETDHLDLPQDLVNGMTFVITKNLLPSTPETKVSVVAALPKPRIVKLAISPRGEEPFSVAGSQRQAIRFEIKVELGGVAGVVAPLIGKQPADHEIWIAAGEIPAFVKAEGFLYPGGPILTIEMASAVWPSHSGPAK